MCACMTSLLSHSPLCVAQVNEVRPRRVRQPLVVRRESRRQNGPAYIQPTPCQRGQKGEYDVINVSTYPRLCIEWRETAGLRMFLVAGIVGPSSSSVAARHVTCEMSREVASRTASSASSTGGGSAFRDTFGREYKRMIASWHALRKMSPAIAHHNKGHKHYCQVTVCLGSIKTHLCH